MAGHQEPRTGFKKPEAPLDPHFIQETFERFSQAHLAYLQANRSERSARLAELEVAAQAHRKATLGY